MRKTILTLALIAATPAAAQAQAPQTSHDREARIQAFQQACATGLQRAGRGEAPRVRNLGEAPPARHERAVLRTIYGCPVPVIVSHDVENRGRNGSAPRQ
ncbi:MAG TPA: hypothetical protein VEA44_13775 [Caulobacter sp.]|nr:hypothetical protein [Caulobacter sp.]